MTATYKITLKKSAEKELRSIPSHDLVKVVERIKNLAHQPRPHGCEKMEGGDRYRVRQGDWRVLYTIDDPERSVVVFKIGNRREVYR